MYRMMPLPEVCSDLAGVILNGLCLRSERGTLPWMKAFFIGCFEIRLNFFLFSFSVVASCIAAYVGLVDF